MEFTALSTPVGDGLTHQQVFLIPGVPVGSGEDPGLCCEAGGSASLPARLWSSQCEPGGSRAGSVERVSVDDTFGSESWSVSPCRWFCCLFSVIRWGETTSEARSWTPQMSPKQSWRWRWICPHWSTGWTSDFCPSPSMQAWPRMRSSCTF